MKVTYIYHSSFAVELEKSMLIFDYYGKGDLPERPAGKQVYFLNSHSHPDHFSKTIFNLREQFGGAEYVLAREIRLKPEEKKDWIHSLKPETDVEIGNLKIRTLKSTDLGVAFVVETEGRRIYHAGDLNWWHWEEESIDYNRQMRKDYQREIRKLVRKKIDLAFVVLDPRQGGAAFSGIDFFMRNVRVNHVFPMHMWRDYGLTDRLLTSEISASYRNRIHRVWEEGQTVEIHGQKGET